MIKILILTDDPWKWIEYLESIMKFNTVRKCPDRIIVGNEMFSFYFVSHIYEYMRGYAFAHVIEDKKIDDEIFYQAVLPTIKQKVTQYGSRTILGER
jgi:hypothetical protein